MTDVEQVPSLDADVGLDAIGGDHRPPSTRITRSPPRYAARLLKPLIVPALLVGLWVGLTETHSIAEVFLPPPIALWNDAHSLGSILPHAIFITVQQVFLGVLIGGSVGIITGLLFGYSKWTRELLELTLDTIRPMPVFALIPLFILWFGIGKRSQILLVSFGVFLILSLSTIDAVRNVPRIFVRAALTCGASRYQVYRTVVLPAVVPSLVTGLRYGVVAAWGLDVAAEFTGSQTGLGYIMIVRQQYLDTAGIALIVLIFCLLAILTDRVLRFLGYRLTRWTARTSETGFVAEMLGGK